MAAEDKRGKRISQLSFPGGQGSGGEAGRGEPLLAGVGEWAGLLLQPEQQLQPDRGPAGVPMSMEWTSGWTTGVLVRRLPHIHALYTYLSGFSIHKFHH